MLFSYASFEAQWPQCQAIWKKKGYMLDRVAILILSILVNILSRMSLADSAKENMEFAKEVYSSLL